MRAPSPGPTHIEITQTLLRLYIFLAQHLDRCLNEAARATFPEQELQAHLATTRTEVMALLSVNRVVKGKVEEECRQVLDLATAALTEGPGKAAAVEAVKAESAVLKHKNLVLSDLLAVFRAI
jgi:hypothetical protein